MMFFGRNKIRKLEKDLADASGARQIAELHYEVARKKVADLENRLAHYVSQPPMICSFCDKEHTQVAKLIAGRTGFICDDCTRIAMDVLIEEGRK